MVLSKKRTRQKRDSKRSSPGQSLFWVRRTVPSVCASQAAVATTTATRAQTVGDDDAPVVVGLSGTWHVPLPVLRRPNERGRHRISMQRTSPPRFGLPAHGKPGPFPVSSHATRHGTRCGVRSGEPSSLSLLPVQGECRDPATLTGGWRRLAPVARAPPQVRGRVKHDTELGSAYQWRQLDEETIWMGGFGLAFPRRRPCHTPVACLLGWLPRHLPFLSSLPLQKIAQRHHHFPQFRARARQSTPHTGKGQQIAPAPRSINSNLHLPSLQCICLSLCAAISRPDTRQARRSCVYRWSNRDKMQVCTKHMHPSRGFTGSAPILTLYSTLSEKTRHYTYVPALGHLSHATELLTAYRD